MAGFDWDPSKAASNYQKHGIRFEDAIDVFDDPWAATEDDPDPDEERFKIVGMMASSVITVIYTERGEDAVRIISARRATKHEIKTYGQG
jgi:uncharacterized DUF497 family protein